MLKNTILSAGLVAATGLLGVANCDGAQLFNLSGASGSYSESGQALFNFSTGQVTITIDNTYGASQSDGNGIIAIGFDLTGNPSLTVDENATVGYELLYDSGTLTQSSYEVVDGGSGNAKATPPTQPMTNPWTLAPSGYGSDTYLLGELNGGQPSDLILNPSETANASVGQHSPSLESGAVFTLDSSAITTASTASNIEVYFGTNRDSNGLPTGTPITGTPVTVPAGGQLPVPATLPLVGGGILALGALALRKRGKFQ